MVVRGYPSVSICAPAYNEEQNIEAFLDECWEALEGKAAKAKLDYELVIVDDGSRDRTFELLTLRAARWPQLRVVKHPHNRGIAAGVFTSAAAASKEYVFIIGCDGQWKCADLWPMLEKYREGSDIVVGVRQNRTAVYARYRRFVSDVYRFGTRVLLGVDLRDAGALKLGPREVLAAKLTSTSVYADAERLVRGVRKGHSIGFVPCHFSSRTAGVATGAKPKVVLAAAVDLLRVFVAVRLRGG